MYSVTGPLKIPWDEKRYKYYTKSIKLNNWKSNQTLHLLG